MVSVQQEPYRVEPASVTTSEVVPISFSTKGYVEEIAVAGSLLLMFGVSVNAAGETHVEIAINPLDITATSLSSGTPYHVLVTPASTFDPRNTPPLEFTFAFSLRLMGRGSENDLLMYETLHVMIASDCTVVTTPKESFSVLRRSTDRAPLQAAAASPAIRQTALTEGTRRFSRSTT